MCGILSAGGSPNELISFSGARSFLARRKSNEAFRSRSRSWPSGRTTPAVKLVRSLLPSGLLASPASGAALGCEHTLARLRGDDTIPPSRNVAVTDWMSRDDAARFAHIRNVRHGGRTWIDFS